jgi:hypothetical protein
MALTVGLYGDNPQQPFIAAESYIPDQLIAGNLKLVSEQITVSGSAQLPRGTVMGISKFAALTSSVGKTPATGTVIVAALPTDGDTVTIFGTAITFNLQSQVGQLPRPQQVLFTSSMTTAQVAQALLAALKASSDANIVKGTYSLSASTVTLTSVAFGTGANALTLATSNGTAFTVSGATLTGGTANTGTATIGTISGGPATKPGNYLITLTGATTGNVEAPTGEVIGTMTMGTAFVDPEINFTITTGGSPAAGDIFSINVPDSTQANVWKLCTAGATDGSNVPAGILADFVDPTGGNVGAGAYVQGEFNANAIVYDSSLSVSTIRNAFRGNGIFIKNAVSAADPT